MTSQTATRPHGVIVPLPTPLDADRLADPHAVRHLVEAQVPLVDGIFVLGSSGELSWLTEEQADTVRLAARESTRGRVQLFVGVGDTSLPRTLDRLDRLGDDACDYVVVTSPFYYPVGQAALVRYFTEVADRSPAPVVLYNIPQNTGLVLSTATLTELAAHPNIVGVKDSSGDMFGFMEMLTLSGPGFSVLQGREQLLLPSFAAGADGMVSSLGNVAPALLRSAIDATRSGDMVRAGALQREITQLATLFEHGYWLSALKTAMDLLGFPVGAPTPPLEPSTPRQRAAIAAAIGAAEPGWLLAPTGGGAR